MQDTEVARICSTAVLHRLCKAGKIQATSFVVSLIFGTSSQTDRQHDLGTENSSLDGVQAKRSSCIAHVATKHMGKFGLTEGQGGCSNLQNTPTQDAHKCCNPGDKVLDTAGTDATCHEAGTRDLHQSVTADEALNCKAPQEELASTSVLMDVEECRTDAVAAASRPKKRRKHDRTDLDGTLMPSKLETSNTNCADNVVAVAHAALPFISLLKSRGVLNEDSAWPVLRTLLRPNAADTESAAAIVLKCFDATADQVRAVHKVVTVGKAGVSHLGDEARNALVAFCSSNKRPGVMFGNSEPCRRLCLQRTVPTGFGLYKQHSALHNPLNHAAVLLIALRYNILLFYII
jgi:hypothetical protein